MANPMEPQVRKPRKQHASKVMLAVSLTFHTLIVVGLAYFAAREGLLGKQLKKIAVQMVKEKPPEKPKEPEKPKQEPPKVEPPKLAKVVKPEAPKAVAPAPRATTPPPNAAPPAVAPPSVDVPSFVFEGGKTVDTTSDPVAIYKNSVEFALHSRWERPADVQDRSFVAEVEISIDRTGLISGFDWKKRSGHAKWDEAVRRAVSAAKSISRPPPTNFPSRVLVRFDVQEEIDSTAQVN